jgi:cutinase
LSFSAAEVKCPATRVRRGARTVPATLASLFIVAATMGYPVVPTASAADCPDIEVVFARGTDEPPGIGKVGQALVDSIKALAKKKSVNAYAVQYPASWDFLGVVDGANDASAHVQATAAKCPKTRIVLGGYSQGAAVVDVITTSPIGGVGFKAPMPPAMANHVAAVTVFGNPSARVGQPLTTLSPLYGARTADMCNANDPICSLGKDFGSHVRYPESGLVKRAAQWAVDHV